METVMTFQGACLAIATKKEAEDQALDLRMRWYAVLETRAVESEDPVNYAYVDGKLVAVEEVK
jgi:hypothetical protein